jgi:hypothetical protein
MAHSSGSFSKLRSSLFASLVADMDQVCLVRSAGTSSSFLEFHYYVHFVDERRLHYIDSLDRLRRPPHEHRECHFFGRYINDDEPFFSVGLRVSKALVFG